MGNGYDLIYRTSPGCTWLQAYRLKPGFHIYEVMATYARQHPPCEVYVIAKNKKEAIKRFQGVFSWLDIIVSVDMCDPEKESYICNDFHRHPVNII